MFFGPDRVPFVRQMILSAPDVKSLRAKIASIEKELARNSNSKTAALEKELTQAKKELAEPSFSVFVRA